MVRCARVLVSISLLFLSLTFIQAGRCQSPSRGATDAQAPKAEAGLRFAVVGDTGTGDSFQLRVAGRMQAEHQRRAFDLVLMLGDNVYGGDFRKIGELFERPYKPLIDSGVKFFATLGNHDIRCEQEEMNYPLFNMGGRRAYSFAPAGDLVEFFTIDTTSLLLGAHVDQITWLEAALAASRARWKIVFFHHPPYSPGRRHGNNEHMLARVVPVLKRGGVRVVLSGHEHFFAKLRPVEGIDYIISGAGGKLHNGGLRGRSSELIAGNDQLRHFLIVTLTENHFNFSAIAETGELIYRGSIPLKP